jgi:SPP1 family predicted phage head-tail adaptor
MRRKGTADLYAGNLRHRVAFLARKTTVVSGKTSEHWETVCECWADIEPLKGREYFEAAAVNREDSVRFIIRYRTDITAEMTLRFRDTDYNIESIINPDMRGARLEILARSVT